MKILYSKFNNKDSHIAVMKGDERGVVIIDKPTHVPTATAPVTDEVFDYASDEIGAFFMNACKRNK